MNYLRCSSATAEAGADAERDHLLRRVPEGEFGFLCYKCRFVVRSQTSAIGVTTFPLRGGSLAVTS